MVFQHSKQTPSTHLHDMQGNPEAFQLYLQQYSNTICGRHPIAILLNVSAAQVLQKVNRADGPGVCHAIRWLSSMPAALQMLRHSSGRHRIELKKYDQSSRCTRMSDSSVSYVAAIVSNAQ